MIKIIISAIYRGWIPDFILRFCIRLLLLKRLSDERSNNIEKAQEKLSKFISDIKLAPIAVLTEKANEQHYEVPAKFYQEVLGKNLKYSSCFWPSGVSDLSTAEAAMLEVTCERAQIKDGMEVLELGCGWGSLSLWMAKNFPNCKITAVSNSTSQKTFIDNCASEIGLKNLEVITCNINTFNTEKKFDRVVSVEMFEHMRNFELLLSQIAKWLKVGGKLFVHIFCHKEYAYLFESAGTANWMGRYFFSGGMMPSNNLLLNFQKDLKIEEHIAVSGTHYSKTAKAWHDNMHLKREKVTNIFKETYGGNDQAFWYVQWKLFFMACEVLFGFRSGNEWFVSHYRFVK